MGFGSQPRRGLKGDAKSEGGSAMTTTSRRDFLKIATAGAAGAAFAPQASRAGSKTVTP
jgi:hypothetical protein